MLPTFGRLRAARAPATFLYRGAERRVGDRARHPAQYHRDQHLLPEACEHRGSSEEDCPEEHRHRSRHTDRTRRASRDWAPVPDRPRHATDCCPHLGGPCVGRRARERAQTRNRPRRTWPKHRPECAEGKDAAVCRDLPGIALPAFLQHPAGRASLRLVPPARERRTRREEREEYECPRPAGKHGHGSDCYGAPGPGRRQRAHAARGE